MCVEYDLSSLLYITLYLLIWAVGYRVHNGHDWRWPFQQQQQQHPHINWLRCHLFQIIHWLAAVSSRGPLKVTQLPSDGGEDARLAWVKPGVCVHKSSHNQYCYQHGPRSLWQPSQGTHIWDSHINCDAKQNTTTYYLKGNQYLQFGITWQYTHQMVKIQNSSLLLAFATEIIGIENTYKDELFFDI